MKGFSWLHVSDIHFRPDNEWKDNQPRQKLLETLSLAFADKRTPKVNAIFCTGDIAFGELSSSPLREQYQSARVFFEELRTVCNLPVERVFFVPGNHDIDRGTINRMAHTTLQNLADSSHIHWEQMNADFARPSADIKAHLKKLDQYLEFVQSYAPHCVGRGGSAHYAHAFEHDSVRVGVAGLNSAWACSGAEKGDKDRVWIAAKAQLDSIAAQTKSVDLRIALMHHPLDWLPPADKRWADQRLSSEYDFFLHGHTHDLTVTAGQSLFTIRSGATCADTPIEFGFNMVHVDYGRKKVSARGWMYVDHHNQWESRTLGNQRNYRNGANVFAFKPGFRAPSPGGRPVPAQGDPGNALAATAPGDVDARPSTALLSASNLSIQFEPRPAALETINAHTPAGRARLTNLITSGSPFSGIVSDGAEPVLSPVVRAVERLEEAVNAGQPLRLAVRGVLGTGRLQFLLFVYVALQARGQRCLFIDLDSVAVRPEEIEAQVSAALKTPGKAVALVYESGQRRPRHDVWRIIDLLGDLPMVDASLSDPGGPSWQVGSGADRAAVARAYINLVRDITPAKVSTDELHRDYVKLCDQHRLKPDFYSARLFCRNPMQPYGQAMKTQLELRIQRLPELKSVAAKRNVPDEPKARSSLAKKLLVEVAEYGFARDTLDEGKARARAQDGIPEIHETLCAQSEHVSPMLAALGQVSALKFLFDLTRTSKTPDLKTHRHLLHELDYVQTCTINVFVKEIINKWDDYRVEAADGLLRLLRVDEGSAYLLKFKANICYILGRIDRPQDHHAIVGSLSRLIANVTSQTRFIELAKQVVGALSGLDPKSHHLLNGATKAFSVMLDENGLDKNDLSIVQLTRLERRCMLLTRSAYISLAMLGEKDRAIEYARRVLSSPLENDLNRGFHRAYFLDIKGKRADALLDTDKDLGTCDATIDALLKALATRPDPAMATVQALTLGCLVRARLNPLDPGDSAQTATPEQRQEVAAAISRFLADQGTLLPSDIRLALEQLTREIRFGKWVLEKMIDDLFALKFQRRVGWGGVSRPETVASHSMFVQLLSAMFGGERHHGELEQELPDSFPLYHDLGEAVVSDIPYPNKGERTSREEKSVVQSIGLMGLACGIERMAKLPEHFGSFESAKSGAHNDKDDSVAFYNDMDRLELLIQFHRYMRDGEKMAREDEFRKHVLPERFLTTQGKSLADRFTKYFKSPDSSASNESGLANLWPIPQKLMLVDKIGTFTG